MEAEKPARMETRQPRVCGQGASGRRNEASRAYVALE